MRSAKRHLPIVLLGLVVLCSAAAYAADDDDKVTTYPGPIGVYNPCNNSLVSVTGTNYVRYHENARDHEGTHVFVDLKYVGYGKDAQGNPYRTVLEAKGQFKAEQPNYDLQFREKWEGIKGAPDFSMDGTVRVDVQGGVVTGDGITQFDTTCGNGNSHDSDKDQDHHSH